MIYREAGQFKSSYAADMAVFPLKQDRIGIVVIILLAYSMAFFGSTFIASGGADPVPDLCARGDRAEHAGRL